MYVKMYSSRNLFITKRVHFSYVANMYSGYVVTWIRGEYVPDLLGMKCSPIFENSWKCVKMLTFGHIRASLSCSQKSGRFCFSLVLIFCKRNFEIIRKNVIFGPTYTGSLWSIFNIFWHFFGIFINGIAYPIIWW